MATNTNPFYTYSATAGSSKTLQKPQDGGDNNQWGNYINTDLDEIVSAVNALSDKIADASENTLVDFTATADAVNHVGVTNAAAGNGPTISAAGSDTNVDLTLTAKGTGDINLTPGTNGDVNIPASKGITFGDDGEKIEGDGTDLTIASSNDLNLTATTDINVPADVGLTFGNDGEKIEGDGTDLTVASSGEININSGTLDLSAQTVDVTLNAAVDALNFDSNTLSIDASNNRVGIGTAAPATDLDTQGLQIRSDQFWFTGGALRFVDKNSGTNERMRIDSSGYLFLNTTSHLHATSSQANVAFDNNNVVGIVLKSTAAGSSGMVYFVNNSGTLQGSITTTGYGSTAFNTSSDYRLKENVTPLTGAIDRLNQLKPSRFNFIADSDKRLDGFLAHEVSDIVPEAVTGKKDAMTTEEFVETEAVFDEEGNEITPAIMGTREVIKAQGIDQSKLVPLLVASVQELSAKVTALENA